MSFLESRTEVQEGDMVILYLSVSSQYAIDVVPLIKNRNGHYVENKFQTVYGMLDVMTLVGKKYGSKLNLPRGWGYILSPSCELWTKNLPHRTQIIYTPDISMIIMGLNLSPGSVVIEAGKERKKE
jgi:tRNA (adenine57-N1/adenine58-N1)-methyltransferase